MSTNKVQHELSPEFENKIVSLAKIGIKMYVIMAIIGITIFALFTIFVVKPIFEKSFGLIDKTEQQFDQQGNSFDEKYNAAKKQIEETQKKIENSNPTLPK